MCPHINFDHDKHVLVGWNAFKLFCSSCQTFSEFRAKSCQPTYCRQFSLCFRFTSHFAERPLRLAVYEGFPFDILSLATCVIQIFRLLCLVTYWMNVLYILCGNIMFGAVCSNRYFLLKMTWSFSLSDTKCNYSPKL